MEQCPMLSELKTVALCLSKLSKVTYMGCRSSLAASPHIAVACFQDRTAFGDIIRKIEKSQDADVPLEQQKKAMSCLPKKVAVRFTGQV